MKHLAALRPSAAVMATKGKKRPRPEPTPVVEYPPGFFLHLVLLHNWPPRFEPSLGRKARYDFSEQGTIAARSARSAGIEHGTGWGNGTIGMPKTPKNAAPDWLVPRK